MRSFEVKFDNMGHFGNSIRYVTPVKDEKLLALHEYFDSDYANGFSGWKPHVTVYKHSEPTEIVLSEEIVEKLEGLINANIIGIELGEFFPPKHIMRVLFSDN